MTPCDSTPDRSSVHRGAPRDVGSVSQGFSPVRDPLNRASSHAKLSGDLMETGASRSRQSVTDSLFDLGGRAGAAKGFAALGAARLGPGNASTHAFHDHAAFELGKHTHHLEHGLAGRRRGVDALLM
jgi:hypothetical protein